MGERSFADDVKQLGYGAGQVLRGEGILAITKALLQSGVSYVGGYPGAPISHLLDVMADANEPLLRPMGIYYEMSGSEAAAAALLGASINYPMRGAVTWKSVVGTNVASDALSHVASAGVIGGVSWERNGSLPWRIQRRVRILSKREQSELTVAPALRHVFESERLIGSGCRACSASMTRELGHVGRAAAMTGSDSLHVELKPLDIVVQRLRERHRRGVQRSRRRSRG